MGIHEGNATKKPGQKENFALYDKESMLETICGSYSFLKKGRAISASFDDDDFSHMFYVFKNNFMSRPGYMATIREGIPYVTSPFYSETEVDDKKILDYYPLKLMIQNLIEIGDSCQYASGFENIKIHEGYSIRELARQAYAKARNVLAFVDANVDHFEVDVDHDDVTRLSAMLSKRIDNFDDYSNVLAEVARGMLSEKTIGDGFGFVTGVKRKDKVKGELVKGPAEYVTIVKDEMPAESAETSLVATSKNIPKATSAAAAKMKPKVACTDPDDEMDYIRELSNLERDMLLKTIDFGQLRTRMKERVIGQDNAIDEIVDSYVMLSLGTHNPKKPKNFLAVGPTGVGKNYVFEVMVETVAEMLQVSFPLRLFECGSFNSEASVNNFLGSQKGYVNSEQDGALYIFYKKARFAPFSMILFDEYEKAHASLEKLLLPILDRGSLHDNKDHFIDMRSMFIGFTSNLGYSDQRGSCDPIGFFAEDREVAEMVKRRYTAERIIKEKMSPEFLGRANIIHFESLTRESIEKIFALEFAKVASRYGQYGLSVEYDDSAKAYLMESGFSIEFGARNITNTIERNVNNPLSLIVQRDLSYDIAEIRNALDYIRNTKAREISYESESSKRRVDAKQRNPRIDKEDLDTLVPQEHVQLDGMRDDVFESIGFKLPYSRILVSYTGSSIDFKKE